MLNDIKKADAKGKSSLEPPCALSISIRRIHPADSESSLSLAIHVNIKAEEPSVDHHLSSCKEQGYGLAT